MVSAYVVLFFLEPVEWLLRSVSTVTGGSLHLAIGWVCAAATRKLRLSKSNVRRATSDVAPETIHVV